MPIPETDIYCDINDSDFVQVDSSNYDGAGPYLRLDINDTVVCLEKKKIIQLRNICNDLLMEC